MHFLHVIPSSKMARCSNKKGRVRLPFSGAGIPLPCTKTTPVRAPAFAGAQHQESAREGLAVFSARWYFAPQPLPVLAHKASQQIVTSL